MIKIILFTLDGCPHCISLKNRLINDSIPFIELDVDENPEIWGEVIEEIKHDFLPTTLITNIETEEGLIFVPTIDYQTEDEIFEIIRNTHKRG
jgi:glutaredoxin